MANVTAKTSSNIFYKARCEAATHNEQLSSREGAADYMSIDRGRLYRIESGIAVPYPEEIRLITHDPTMKARFPQNLDVVKTENGSKVIY